MSKLALLLTLVAAAACTKNESRLDQVASRGTVAIQRPGATGGGSPEDRLARLERKVDKIAQVLDQAMGPAQPDPTMLLSVPVSPNDPVEGPADAKVTVVEVFEFMCPYCYLINPTVEHIREKFPNDVRVVSKYMVIHGQPGIAAGMIGCAASKQGKYSQVKAALWNGLFTLENGQPRPQAENTNFDAMKKLAVAAGADAGRLEEDLKDPSCQEWLRSSGQALAQLGVNATPTIFINGVYATARSPEEFDAAIQAAIAKTDKAIADGVPQGEYYQREVVAKGAKRSKGRFED